MRELRQNLSVYLRRVKAGDTLEVTEHNQPVARLIPYLDADTAVGRLLASGNVVSLASGDLADLPPLPPVQPLQPGSISVSEALQQQKEERLP